MNTHHFDQLVKSLVATGSRRGVLGWLVTLPLASGLAALVGEEETDAKGRRRRRKKRHKHRKGRHKHKKHKKACKPHSHTKTCAGKCGKVKNNCKKTVDCGPCDCDPPCGTCQTCTDALVCEPCDPCCNDVCCSQANAICHTETGACCVPDSKAQTCNGQCGDVVNNCGVTVDCGPCICDEGCPACQVCDETDGECVADLSQKGDACGADGQVCQSDGSCTCDANSCPACTTCENNGFCEACSGCCDGSICVAACPACETCDGQGQCVSCASLGQICCNDTCVDGVCCEDNACLSAGAPDCIGHECVCAANGNTACSGSEDCCDDGCTNTDTDPDHCGSCGETCSGATPVCRNGACACDVASCGPCATCQGDGACAPIADGTCCPEGVCIAGVCAARATLAMCGGRCDDQSLPATFQCTGGGDPVPCPSCEEGCAASGCANGGSRLFTDEGESFYCVTSVAPVGICSACPTDIPNPMFCPQSCQNPGTLCQACPAGEGCLLTACLEICTGT